MSRLLVHRATMHAGEAARKREQQAFDHELPREPRARRAERRSRGDLLHPAARERQQQVRDVCARRDQHERHGAEEQPQRSASRTEHRIRIRHDRSLVRSSADRVFSDRRRASAAAISAPRGLGWRPASTARPACSRARATAGIPQSTRRRALRPSRCAELMRRRRETETPPASRRPR